MFQKLCKRFCEKKILYFFFENFVITKCKIKKKTHLGGPLTLIFSIMDVFELIEKPFEN